MKDFYMRTVVSSNTWAIGFILINFLEYSGAGALHLLTSYVGCATTRFTAFIVGATTCFIVKTG